MTKTEALPYFDTLLKRLDAHPELRQAFGRHVHWGYWPTPPARRPDVADFAEAAERLSMEVCAAAGLADGMQVLDVGCGLGGTLAGVDQRLRDVRMLGLNIEHRQLQRAQEQARPSSSNQLDWVCADACRLPFADNSFDAITAVECIFHFPDRQMFLREAQRVLKPGGRLALSDFIARKRLRPFTWLRGKLPRAYSFYGQCNIHCDVAQYRALAGHAGLAFTEARDITRNTLPTYAFLRDLSRQINLQHLPASIETLFLEQMSQIGWVRYTIISMQKPLA